MFNKNITTKFLSRDAICKNVSMEEGLHVETVAKERKYQILNGHFVNVYKIEMLHLGQV
jgi:hypothetical protein